MNQRKLASPVAAWLFFTLLALGAGLVGCGTAPGPDDVPAPGAPPLGLDRTELFNFLANGNPAQAQKVGTLPPNPFYASWDLFPGPAGDPDEFLNKRLNIATHGRWVTVRVNPTALHAINGHLSAVASGGGTIPSIDMPDGSIIVKANYPNVNEVGVIAQAPDPAVLTVLYKPGGGVCESGVKFNGTDCLGGGWMWAFYGLDAPHLPRDGFDKFVGANTQAFCINCHDPAFHNDYLRSLERLSRNLANTQEPTRDPAKPPTIVDNDPLCKNPVLSPDIPLDVAVDPTTLPADQRQQLFDCFSWRAFVGLNWPADPEQRGTPDPGSEFGDFSGGKETVWETYKATYEVFQPQDVDWDPTDPQNPASQFNSKRPVPASCSGSGDLPVVAMVSKSNSRFGDTPPDVANETGQAFAGQFGTLTDRNGELVRYQVLFNETEWEFLLPTAKTKDLTPAGPNGGQGVVFPDGSMEVKAAWKVLCSAEDVAAGTCKVQDDIDTYYRRSVYAFDAGSNSCESVDMGLIGLHVIAKSFWAPQWIWATFSHTHNVPPLGTSEDTTYAFYDPACKEQPNHFPSKACSAQPFLAPKGKGDPCCPNVPLNRWPEIGFGSQPNQLTRLDPIDGSGLNGAFTALMGAKDPAFENYVLVRTQWPLHGRRPAAEGEELLPVNTQLCKAEQDQSSHPETGIQTAKQDPNCYTAIPQFSRNVVIESYMTTYVDDHSNIQQISNRSCMTCHKAGTNFSYIWVDAVEQVVPISQ